MKRENLKKLLLNVLGISVGLIVFVVIINTLAFPSNYDFSINPIDAFSAYFFFWGFTLDKLGLVLGSLMLAGFILLIDWGVVALGKLICRKCCQKQEN